MFIMGLDLTDDSLRGTPHRVAKMFVKEVFSGLNPANKPEVKLFENKYQYNEMLIEKNISLYSYCEHHFVPIIGKAHVAYIKWKCNWPIQNKSSRTILCKTPAGTGKADQSNCGCIKRSFAN